MLIKDLDTQCPPCPFCRGEAEKFLNLAKGGDFLNLRGRMSKRGGRVFSESNFQLLIKYHR